MTRGQVRRRLAIDWWKYLALALVPLFVLNALFGQYEALLPVLTMPMFIAGVASMFVSLKFFGGYKHALIATQKAPRYAWRTGGLDRSCGPASYCIPCSSITGVDWCAGSVRRPRGGAVDAAGVVHSRAVLPLSHPASTRLMRRLWLAVLLLACAGPVLASLRVVSLAPSF